MKRNLFVLVLLVIMLVGSFVSCDMGQEGNGNVVSQKRTVEGFDGITLGGAGNVNVHTGENFKVIVRTDCNLQDRVVTAVNGNTLRIDQIPGNFNASELTINVYMPELKNISLSGAGIITIIAGSTSEMNFSLSGVGNINAQDFQVENITISLSGVGNARIWATNTLDGTLSGVGNIFYKGSPAININRTGIGNIRPL